MTLHRSIRTLARRVWVHFFLLYTRSIVPFPFTWDASLCFQRRNRAESHSKWIDLKYIKNNRSLKGQSDVYTSQFFGVIYHPDV